MTNAKELTGQNKVEKVKLRDEQKSPHTQTIPQGSHPSQWTPLVSCLRFAKIVKPNVPRFNGNPLEYSKFRAAFKVEVDDKEFYDATEKLKFLLDALDGGAKSCLVQIDIKMLEST